MMTTIGEAIIAAHRGVAAAEAERSRVIRHAITAGASTREIAKLLPVNHSTVWRWAGGVAATKGDALSQAIDMLNGEPRRMTTPFDDPIVQACVDHGGHYWPADAPDDKPATCTRCWYNPSWVAGATPNECPPEPVRDEPQA